jgi:hypothetical protein
MQTPSAPQPQGKAALLSGGTLGVILGIIHSVITIMLVQFSQNDNAHFSSLLYVITPLIWIIGLLLAGIWGSYRTGKVGIGTLSGLFAGTFGGIIAGFGQVIAIALLYNQSNPDSDISGLLLLSGVAAVIYVLVLAIGTGAGLGALGGLIGQSFSKVVQPPVQALLIYPPQVVPPPAPAPHTYMSPQQPIYAEQHIAERYPEQ